MILVAFAQPLSYLEQAVLKVVACWTWLDACSSVGDMNQPKQGSANSKYRCIHIARSDGTNVGQTQYKQLFKVYLL